MSTNCIVCVKSKRTGSDLLCDECRAVEPSKRKHLFDTGALELEAMERGRTAHAMGAEQTDNPYPDTDMKLKAIWSWAWRNADNSTRARCQLPPP